MTAARLQTKRPRPRDVASSSVDYGCAECSYDSDVTILLWMDNLTVYFDSYGIELRRLLLGSILSYFTD